MKLYAIHTTEENPRDRNLVVIGLREDRTDGTILLHNYGRGRKVVAERIGEKDLEKLMAEYQVQ